ncbi:hypothetical protein [Roseicyclus persicicus]|uniref:Pilus assembly protein n=1 Tax=Roseicyclus persicicus TaxID=2650661 RepID=A0A7X6GYU6_9RHOB|nr:hypothetical protein [Roseibacterium persicicum]NKX44194.1 hypothetical protein [Roseibacterium persicicum]
MTNLIKNFAKSESGAVTVDWVVLTAALVGLGLAVMAVVSGGVQDLSGEVQAALGAQNPGGTDGVPAFGTAIIGGGDTLAD